MQKCRISQVKIHFVLMDYLFFLVHSIYSKYYMWRFTLTAPRSNLDVRPNLTSVDVDYDAKVDTSLKE